MQLMAKERNWSPRNQITFGWLGAAGSAVAPALRAEWGLSESGGAWLTLAVQLGFVNGTLVSALGNLPDVLSARRLFAASALLGAIANAGVAFAARGSIAFGIRRLLIKSSLVTCAALANAASTAALSPSAQV